MGGVGGVLHDTFCFAGASCKENVQDGGERGTNDFCSGVHCPLEGLAVNCTAVFKVKAQVWNKILFVKKISL